MIVLILVLLISVSASAQSIDAGSIGRSGVHDLSIKTGSNLNWNPAVLAQPGGFRWSLELPSVAGAAANNAFSVQFWNDHLSGDRFFSTADKNQILDRIPSEGWRANAQGTVPLLGFTYNRFGFHATLEESGHAVAQRDIIQFALWGNQVDRVYAFTDLSGDQELFADYSAGFGYKYDQAWIPALYFGAGFHFYHGFDLIKAVRAEGNLATTDTTITGSAVVHAVTSKAGDGVGFDLGTMAAVSQHLQLGLSFRQIGAKLTWNVDKNYRHSLYTDSTGLMVDSLGESGYLDRALHRVDTVYEGGAIETQLPMVIQFNGRYVVSSQWTLLGDASFRTVESVKGPAGADAALAAEFMPNKWLVFQGGVGGGNLWGLHTGVGAGLRFRRYEFDLGGGWNGGVFNSARGVALGMTQRLKF
jgi:hypothetical protein